MFDLLKGSYKSKQMCWCIVWYGKDWCSNFVLKVCSQFQIEKTTEESVWMSHICSVFMSVQDFLLIDFYLWLQLLAWIYLYFQANAIVEFVQYFHNINGNEDRRCRSIMQCVVFEVSSSIMLKYTFFSLWFLYSSQDCWYEIHKLFLRLLKRQIK